jgi:hypothetical protein
MLIAALLTLCSLSCSLAEFDKERCYQKCRRTPGFMARVTLCSDGHYSDGSEDNCMQECDRQFWKDFDDKTRDLGKKMK